jgi:hypothetical protein
LSWVERFDRAVLARVVPRRTIEHALASGLSYEESPVRDGEIVRASFEKCRVELRMPEDVLLGSCTRCVPSFGPCVHMAALAIDLACLSELRDSLIEGKDTRAAVEDAVIARHALDVELKFEGALRAWMAPVVEGDRVEIAASPFADDSLGRAYGERDEEARLAVFVRRMGDRKLLTAREIASTTFGPRDRRVLMHVRDRGTGRKAAHALGVEADLTPR